MAGTDAGDFPRLETERLILRKPERKDAEAVLQIFSDPEVLRYYNVDLMTRLDEAVALIEARRRRYETGYGVRFAICLKPEGMYIGSCGFESWHRPWRYAEIGYELARPHWGTGLMTEALRAMIRYGFERMHLHRVEAQVEPENFASKAVLFKLGFREEGLARERGYWRREHHDLAQFGLLPQDFT